MLIQLKNALLLICSIMLVSSCSKDDNNPQHQKFTINDISLPQTEGSYWYYIPINKTTLVKDPVLTNQKITIVGDTFFQFVKYGLYQTEQFLDTASLTGSKYLDYNAIQRQSNGVWYMMNWNSDYKYLNCDISQNEMPLFNLNSLTSEVENVSSVHNRCLCDEHAMKGSYIEAYESFTNTFHSFPRVAQIELNFFGNDSLTFEDTVYYEKLWIADGIGVVRKEYSCHPHVYFELYKWEVK